MGAAVINRRRKRMRLELGRADLKKESLTVTFFKVFLFGWLVYFFIFLFVEHYIPGMTFDFMVHDNYADGTNNWFRDFVEVNHWAAKGTSYLPGGYCGNYPPLVLAIAKIFAFLTPNILSEKLSYYEIGSSPAALAVYFSFVALVLGCFVYFIYRYLKQNLKDADTDRTLLPLLVLSFLLSASMIFLFERGNYLYLAIITFMLFLFFYETKPTLSAVMVALCACVKVYPALFLLVFLLDKKYKSFFVAVGVGLAGFFLPMLLLEGTLIEQVSGFLRAVVDFNADSQVIVGDAMPFYRIEQHSNSLSNIFRALAFCFTWGGRYPVQMSFAVTAMSVLSKIASVLLVAISAVALYFTKPLWKRSCIVLCLLLLLPNNTFDYMLAFFLPLIAIALCVGTLADRKYVVIMTLLACIPKAYFYIDYGMDVSIQTVINPILMVLLLVFLTVDAMRERKNKLEQSAGAPDSVVATERA